MIFVPPHVSAHPEASLPLVWFDHGRFHLAFEGKLSYSAAVVTSVHEQEVHTLFFIVCVHTSITAHPKFCSQRTLNHTGSSL